MFCNFVMLILYIFHLFCVPCSFSQHIHIYRNQFTSRTLRVLTRVLISLPFRMAFRMAFRKLTWTKYRAYKILWLVSLQMHQNLNTSHQYSKNYIGFQSNNASITNCVFLHIKHFKFSNLPIFTIVFLFLLTLCLQDHLIHRFCPFHMSEHLWVKGPFLS